MNKTPSTPSTTTITTRQHYWQVLSCLWGGLDAGCFQMMIYFWPRSAQLSSSSDDSTLFTLLSRQVDFMMIAGSNLLMTTSHSGHLLFLSPFCLSYSSDRQQALNPQWGFQPTLISLAWLSCGISCSGETNISKYKLYFWWNDNFGFGLEYKDKLTINGNVETCVMVILNLTYILILRCFQIFDWYCDLIQ